MKRFLTITAAFALVGFALCGGFASDARAAQSKLTPCAPTVELATDPVGIDAKAPRFSWKSVATDAENGFNLKQTAYRVLVASTPEKLAANDGDLWDSGKVASDASHFVEYAGKPLTTFKRCYWKVCVWDDADVASEWTETARWIQGIADPADWKGDWIGQPESVRPDVDLSGASWIVVKSQTKSDKGFAPEYFRKEFVLDRPQSDFDAQNLAATLYFAANRKFELFVNGQKVGYSIGMAFNPDQLRAVDVTEQLVPGKNVVAIIVSNDLVDDGTKYGDGVLRPLALIAKLTVQTLDKSNAPKNLPTPNRFGKPTETVFSLGTDATWKATEGAPDGWNALDFDASSWAAATVLFADADAAPWGKLRRRTETVSPVFQKKFNVAKKVETATLAVCAPGLFEATLDGEKIGDQVLTPAFTRYDRRCLYNVFDLTDKFQNAAPGERELQFVLGHSWYDVRAIVTWNFDAAPWRDFPRMRGWLELQYEDGTTETVATDSSWTYSTSPILFDCVRQGETVDGNWTREILGNVVAVPGPVSDDKLTAQNVPFSKITETFAAKNVKKIGDKTWVVDAGANVAGWARIQIRGQEKGDVLRFRYSERFDGEKIERFDIAQHFMSGTPAYQTGMKGEFQTDFYFCNGTDGETFEPRFTYNGFQFIEVTGLSQEPKPEDFTICVVNTDFNQIGDFECSNELLNDIQAATLTSYRGNFVAGYPTDCPHREKNGWTGDAHLACELAQYNFENTVGYEKWIADLRDEQKPNGNLPGIVPTGDWGYTWGNGPAWDSSLVLIPWYAYCYRGDVRILEDSFAAMQKYVDYMTTRELENGLLSHGLGDWVPVKTVTPVEVTSTAFYYVDAKIVAQTAKILGDDAAFEKYSKLAEEIRTRYNTALYKGDGVYSIGSQTSQATAIHQGFAAALDAADQAAVFAKLVERAQNAMDGHLDVGILGAKYILRTLSEGGRTDLALALMLQEKQPSYADWIRRGAGTLWEDWGEGSSRNHIMFGDVSAWFYQSLAGIKLDCGPSGVVAETLPQTTAFKRFTVEPKCRLAEISAPGFEPLTWAKARFDSPYGEIASEWSWNDAKTELTLTVAVPANATAKIVVPCDETQTCEATNGAEFAKRVADADVQNAAVFEVGSGVYQFKTTAK